MSVWLCLFKPKILLLFSLMRRPITFPFSPPSTGKNRHFLVSLRLSRVVYLLSHLHDASTTPLSFVILFFFVFFPHPPLLLPLSLISSIFNIQPTFTFSNDTLEDRVHNLSISSPRRSENEGAGRKVTKTENYSEKKKGLLFYSQTIAAGKLPPSFGSIWRKKCFK